MVAGRERQALRVRRSPHMVRNGEEVRPDWMYPEMVALGAPYKTAEMVERDRQAAHDRERARVLHEKAVERRKKAKKTRVKRKRK